MQRTLNLSRDVMFHMLPLGRSMPCRLVATVILALLTTAALAAPSARPSPAPVACDALAAR